MKIIHATNIAYFILADDEDYEFLNNFSWGIAKAYNEAALKYHGEFAYLNKID